MSKPRITVITTNYNGSQFLERTICSVLDQAYHNLEYVVMDCGSTDDSTDLIRLYERELADWDIAHCETRCEAINLGLQRATGEIVAFLDCGDRYLPGTLETIATVAGRDEGSWFVGRCLLVGQDDEVLGSIEPSIPRSLASFLMRNSGLLPAPATFYRRRCFQRQPFLDASMRYAFHFDYCCRLLRGGLTPKILSETVASKRQRPATMSPHGIVHEGLEYIKAASRYADVLPLRQRYALWANCDRRRRIYALAEAEAAAEQGQRFMLEATMRRPWWLADTSVRRTVVHGPSHPLPLQWPRKAA